MSWGGEVKLLGKYGTAVQLNIDWKMREEETLGGRGEGKGSIIGYTHSLVIIHERGKIFSTAVWPREIKDDFTKQKFQAVGEDNSPGMENMAIHYTRVWRRIYTRN